MTPLPPRLLHARASIIIRLSTSIPYIKHFFWFYSNVISLSCAKWDTQINHNKFIVQDILRTLLTDATRTKGKLKSIEPLFRAFSCLVCY